MISRTIYFKLLGLKITLFYCSNEYEALATICISALWIYTKSISSFKSKKDFHNIDLTINKVFMSWLRNYFQAFSRVKHAFFGVLLSLMVHNTNLLKWLCPKLPELSQWVPRHEKIAKCWVMAKYCRENTSAQ